jgi:hypothetical protein
MSWKLNRFFWIFGKHKSASNPKTSTTRKTRSEAELLRTPTRRSSAADLLWVHSEDTNVRSLPSIKEPNGSVEVSVGIALPAQGSGIVIPS